MIEILFLMPYMNIGGTEKALLNMLESKGFREKYSVTLMLLHKEGGFLPYVPDWVKIVTLDGYEGFEREAYKSPKKAVISRLKKGKVLSAVKYIKQHLHFRKTQDRSALWQDVAKKVNLHHDREYDIAVSYFGPDDLSTFIVSEIIRAKEKIQWIHFDVSKYVFHTCFAKKYYPKFDKVYAVSDEALNSLLKKVPEISDKASTYYNTVSPELCMKMADEGEGFTDNFDGVRILTVGRLSEEKGQDIIPEVARKLAETGVNFKWYLIGDGELRERIEQLIEKYRLNEKIVLMGSIANPYQYIKNSTICVQPSKHEGFGLTVAEYRIFDKLVVASDIPCFREQLLTYEKSILIEMNEDNLRRAMYEAVQRTNE